jgi:hypothetical protein
MISQDPSRSREENACSDYPSELVFASTLAADYPVSNLPGGHMTIKTLESLGFPCRFFVKVRSTAYSVRVGVEAAVGWLGDGYRLVFLEASKIDGSQDPEVSSRSESHCG